MVFVIKRNKQKEEADLEKLKARIKALAKDLDPKYVHSDEVAEKTFVGLYDGVTTAEIDNLAAETAGNLVTHYPEYSTLAARISISKLHKETKESFSEVIDALYNHKHPGIGGDCVVFISEKFYNTVMRNKDVLDKAINHERDFKFKYLGFKILERSYLVRQDGKVAERPQHLIMRIAVGIHGDDMKSVIEAYDLMSNHYYMHASATLRNAGTTHAQICNCFLTSMESDSVNNVFNTLTNCCQISRHDSGVAVSISGHRAHGSSIPEMVNSVSPGIVPMLRTFNAASRYVDQGAGKRLGAFNMVIEPWHADIFEYLDLKKNHGEEDKRARDIFQTLWIPDLFMKRVETGGKWSLFCPSKAPGLNMVHSQEFEDLYVKYENEKLANKEIPAMQLWVAIIQAQIETGGPFMIYKDTANAKSNQQNLGIIRSANLCVEIIQYTSPSEVAACSCASLALPSYVKVNEETGKEEYDFQKLHDVTKVVIRNLDGVIDANHYPVAASRTSNLRHRPIGLGVQGLADVFMSLQLPFESEGAKLLNKQIFETIYHGALEASVELSERHGPYETWVGSPAQQGKLQYDLWGVTPTDLWDWKTLKERIADKGLRNSLLIAPMPTATISYLFGNNECFEPYMSNMYARRVTAGEFQMVNSRLIKELVKLDIWNDDMRRKIILNLGSVQDIDEIPANIKEIYKTVWEISQKHVIDLSADRGAFVCQSQSLNIFLANPTAAQMTAMHFYGWKKGLKSGLYYLRTRPAVDAIPFTVRP